MEADECKAPALLGVLVLGDVDVADLAVLLEQILKVVVTSAVGQVVHLQGHHPANT